jgi:hypothetical protein
MKITRERLNSICLLHLPAIVWVQNNRNFNEKGYSYAAFYVQDTATWYLAGDAEWYGTRTCTNDQMFKILRDPETENMWHVKDWQIVHTD